jgi:hypothetical protein
VGRVVFVGELRWNTTNTFDVSDTVIWVLARVVAIHGIRSWFCGILFPRFGVYILESEYSNSGIVNAVTGYDASYSFVSADVSATVDLVWNVDNSTDVSYNHIE